MLIFTSNCKAALEGSADKGLKCLVFLTEQATLLSEQFIKPLCKPSKPQMAGMMVSAVVYEIKGRIYKLPSKYKKTRTGQDNVKGMFHVQRSPISFCKET